MIDYCNADHPNTMNGCYGFDGHDGKHWSWSTYVTDCTGETQNHNGTFIWEWDNKAPGVPAGSSVLTLTDAELVALLVALQPVSPYFPGLHAKIEAARESIK